MATIQWHPQVNALTKPISYRIQVVPRNIAGYDEMAADISTEHPVYNADLVRSLAPLIISSGIFGFAFSRRRVAAICCAWPGRFHEDHDCGIIPYRCLTDAG